MTMKSKQANKRRRKARVRARISGTVQRPRLTVFRSLKHITAQLIDDDNSRTLMSASALGIKTKGKNKTEVAFMVGEMLAKKAKDKKITNVVFDRAANRYQGRVKALADGAKKGGLKF